MSIPKIPRVLCLSGHDPSGGAGTHADIQTCAAHGAHALSVITANTVQDTRDVSRVVPVAPMLLAQQLRVLLDDCSVQAIKIGLLGDAQQVPVIAQVIRETRVPVVLDPVLRAGGGSNLVSMQLQAAMTADLFPLTTVLTPNLAEARRLAPGKQTPEGCAMALLAAGCREVLITGGDEPGGEVVNLRYAADRAPQRYVWARVAGRFHGAGCTLAAAIAARLALGQSTADALQGAQAYTHRCLEQAFTIGKGRAIPARGSA